MDAFLALISSEVAAKYSQLTMVNIGLWYAWIALTTAAAISITQVPPRVQPSRKTRLVLFIVMMVVSLPIGAFCCIVFGAPTKMHAAFIGVANFFLSRLTWLNLIAIYRADRVR